MPSGECHGDEGADRRADDKGVVNIERAKDLIQDIGLAFDRERCVGTG